MYRQKRTWAEVSLNNIAHNYRQLVSAVGSDVKVLGVVKANAYGHGSVPVAGVLQEQGCGYLAVATIDEAVELRDSGIVIPIMILGHTSAKYADDLIAYGITQSLSSYEDACSLSEAASKLGKSIKVHLKLDTGMSRLGFICHDGADQTGTILKALRLPYLEFEGVFTHFAVSELLGDGFTQQQFRSFLRTVETLEKNSGIKFKIKHCANSGAMLNYKEMHLDMVRPGIVLYGQYPGADCGRLDLRPAMELKTRIAQIKYIEPGYTVSYGRAYTAGSRRRIATIPIGYADGLLRSLSGRMDVLVRGRRAPQVGKICMDMCMIDITDIPEAETGDVVTIFGTDGGAEIPLDEVAEKAGTINYEILCELSPRVPRLYPRK